MAEALTRRRSDAYDHHPFEASCGHSAECTNSLECPFDLCPAESRSKANHVVEQRAELIAGLREQGLEPQEIAARLNISSRTVFRYLARKSQP